MNDKRDGERSPSRGNGRGERTPPGHVPKDGPHRVAKTRGGGRLRLPPSLRGVGGAASVAPPCGLSGGAASAAPSCRVVGGGFGSPRGRGATAGGGFGGPPRRRTAHERCVVDVNLSHRSRDDTKALPRQSSGETPGVTPGPSQRVGATARRKERSPRTVSGGSPRYAPVGRSVRRAPRRAGDSPVRSPAGLPRGGRLQGVDMVRTVGKRGTRNPEDEAVDGAAGRPGNTCDCREFGAP